VLFRSDLLLSLYRDVQYSVSPRFELEAAVSKLASLSHWTSPEEISSSIEALRAMLKGTPVAPAVAAPAVPAAAAPVEAAPQPAAPVASPPQEPAPTSPPAAPDATDGGEGEGSLLAEFHKRLAENKFVQPSPEEQVKLVEEVFNGKHI
jgi:DNA polymerase-3 subunit gamma/tau